MDNWPKYFQIITALFASYLLKQLASAMEDGKALLMSYSE